MRRLLLGILLIGSTAFAETPKAAISGPSTVTSGSTFVLDARASVSDKPLVWKCSNPTLPFVVVTPNGGASGSMALVPSAPVGVYQFTLVAVGTPAPVAPATAGEITADAAVLIVTVAPAVPPTPEPTPAPPAPTPSPVTAKLPLYATLIVDVNTITPEIAVIRTGTNIRPTLTGLRTNYHTLDVTSPDITTRNLAGAVAKAGGAPALIVQDSGGNVLSAVPAPATEDGVIAVVKKLRGA